MGEEQEEESQPGDASQSAVTSQPPTWGTSFPCTLHPRLLGRRALMGVTRDNDGDFIY